MNSLIEKSFILFIWFIYVVLFDEIMENITDPVSVLRKLGEPLNLSTSEFETVVTSILSKYLETPTESLDRKESFLKLLTKLIILMEKQSPDNSKPYVSTLLKHWMDLGKLYFAESNFFKAEQLFSNLMDFSASHDAASYKKIASKYVIMCQLGYFHDLVRAANMYRYFGDIERGIGLAWRALILSLDIIMRAEQFGLDVVNTVRQIKPHFFVCRSILLEINDDTRPVVKLKLDELYNAYELLSDDIPDTHEEISLWVATHRDSLQYLIPQDTPSLLALTSDGRVVYYSNIASDLDGDMEPFAHLVGGVLTAINSIFIEQHKRLGGAIREIITAEKIIYISHNKSINVAIFCDFLTDELIQFADSLCEELEEEFHDVLLQWSGHGKEIAPIQKFIEKQICQLVS